MTAHINCKKEEIAKTVIMPGDPKRAKFIADKFLTDVKVYNGVRGIYIYTGIYNNKEVSIMASGMGMPSMGIYSYELFKFYDVENIIRVGSCGSYTADINVYDLILASEAYSKSTFANLQNGSNETVISADEKLNNKIINKAKDLKLKLNVGRIHSSDVFYTEIPVFKTMYSDHKCLGVEMESFALFHNAKQLNKKAACILTVSDSFITNEETTPSERENSFTQMMKLALESID